MRWLIERVRAEPILALKAVVWPFSVAVFYGLLRGFDIAVPFKPWISFVAVVWLFFWAFSSLRGIVGYWPRLGHLRFAAPFFLWIGLGSCWGLSGGDLPIKVWVAPPSYARLPSEVLTQSGFGGRRVLLSGSVLHFAQEEGEPPTLVSFAGRQETIKSEQGRAAATSFLVSDEAHGGKAELLVRRGHRKLALWRFSIQTDKPPRIVFTEEPALTSRKTIRLAFEAADDYGIEAVLVRVAPVSVLAGEKAGPVELPLAAPSEKQTRGASYADLTALPWAGKPVTLQLVAVDGAGQKGLSQPKTVTLPSRVLRSPFARALIEERQKLLLKPDAAARDEAANVMAGIARQQGLYRNDGAIQIALRAAAVRLVLSGSPETLDAVRDIMWQAALRLEEGELGLARAELAAAERELSSLLRRKPEGKETVLFALHLKKALEVYLAVLDTERARQTPPLQEMNWPLSTTKETLAPDDLRARFAEIEPLLESGAFVQARAKLEGLQDLIENLRTTPPDLTPAQYKLVEQTSALRALVRGQKKAIEEAASLSAQDRKTYEGKKAWRSGMSRLLAQQQVFLGALRDVLDKIEPPTRLEAKAGENAMQEAISFLQKNELAAAQQKQAEALALMENSLLALSEKMKQALTAQVP